MKVDLNELKAILHLSWPIVLTNLLSMSFALTDMITLGHVSDLALAAGALSWMWINGTLFFAYGVATALDTLVAQAFGAKNYAAMGIAVQRGIIVLTALCFPIAIAWLNAENALLGMGQNEEVSRMAGQFNRTFLIALWPIMIYTALTKYLSSQNIVRPGVVITVIGNLCNIPLNALLVHGFGDWKGLGFIGTPIADATSRIIMCLCLVGYILWSKIYKQSWPILLSPLAFSVQGFREFLALGIPGGFALCLEIWGFEGLTAVAGRLGPIMVASHTVAINICAFTYMIPLGISIAAGIRTGNLVGEGNDHQAKISSRHSISCGAGVMLVSGITLLITRNHIPYIFTSDAEIVQTVSSIIPWATLFQVMDGIQGVCNGILRSIGRHALAAVVTFVGLYAVGLPTGVSLALVAHKGLSGLWAGLSLGILGMACCGLFFILRTNWAKECQKAKERNAGQAFEHVPTSSSVASLVESGRNSEDQEQGIVMKDMKSLETENESENREFSENGGGLHQRRSLNPVVLFTRLQVQMEKWREGKTSKTAVEISDDKTELDA